jgi:hypothetical protein
MPFFAKKTHFTGRAAADMSRPENRPNSEDENS